MDDWDESEKVLKTAIFFTFIVFMTILMGVR